MDNAKLKNIILIILLLLDLCLASILLSDRMDANRREREIRASVAAILEQNGIGLSQGASLSAEAPPPCTALRSAEAELALMNRLVGASSAEDMGGNIFFYRGDNGQASVRGTGETDILFSGSAVPLRGSPEKTVEKLLEGTGLVLCGGAVDPETGDHVFSCTANGSPVYNASLAFDFSGERLSMISGLKVFDTLTVSEEGTLLDASTAALRFVEIVRTEGFICSRLLSADTGYLMTVSVSGEGTLTPVWHMQTDTGELYINALTGRSMTP